MYTRGVDLAAYDYALPAASIAQRPTARRGDSRLLVLGRAGRAYADRRFAELPGLLRSGDCVVVNDSRVIPARVLARTAAGGRPVELVFVSERPDGCWRALVRPGRHCRPGAELLAGGNEAVRLRV